MQMEVEMAVHVIEFQAESGSELFKLRVNFGAKLCAQTALEKIFRTTGGGGLVGKFAASIDQSGNFFRRQSAEWPISRVRCNPTPSRGFAFASSTASSNPASLTIKLAEVRMPSQCAHHRFIDGMKAKVVRIDDQAAEGLLDWCSRRHFSRCHSTENSSR